MKNELEKQVTIGKINEGLIFPEAVAGSETFLPIIQNTFGKCDGCVNWDSGRSVCLKGAISPLVCGPLYEPYGQITGMNDDVGNSEKSGKQLLIKAHVHKSKDVINKEEKDEKS